jgi:hypothetical protein
MQFDGDTQVGIDKQDPTRQVSIIGDRLIPPSPSKTAPNVYYAPKLTITNKYDWHVISHITSNPSITTENGPQGSNQRARHAHFSTPFPSHEQLQISCSAQWGLLSVALLIIHT